MTSFFTTGGMRGHNEKMLAKFYPRTHNMGIKRKVYNQIGVLVILGTAKTLNLAIELGSQALK